MHLLILDDDERIARFLADVAIGRGWTTDITTSVVDFQRRHGECTPDAIMLDLQLGTSDGIEQLHFLRDRSYPGSIVLMSGFDSRVLVAAQQVGVTLGLTVVAVMDKPTRAARVRSVLADIEHNAGTARDDVTAATARPNTAEATVSRAGLISPATISHAISSGQMELYLQPVVSAMERTAVHAEALVRWQHPRAGLLLPEEFVSVAERELPTIEQLTEWVIGEAIRHYRQLADLGFAVSVAVNVSGKNLQTLDFPDRVAVLLDRASVPPDALVLEVTESVATYDSAATADILTRLRLKGLALAIDDFGTGHSSLEALRRLPFSTIKIDKGFVGDMRSSRDALTIVQSIIELARNMGLTCVAEGVENEETAGLLAALGAGGLQGYLFSRPLPFGEFVTWLRAHPSAAP